MSVLWCRYREIQNQRGRYFLAVPIPYLKDIRNCADLKALDELYKSFNWTRGVLTVELVDYHQRMKSWVIRKFEVHTDKLEVCGCGERTLQYVQHVPYGIVMTCGNCRKTMGMLATDGPAFVDLGARRAPLRELHALIRRTGQVEPLNFPQLKGGHLDKFR